MRSLLLHVWRLLPVPPKTFCAAQTLCLRHPLVGGGASNATHPLVGGGASNATTHPLVGGASSNVMTRGKGRPREKQICFVQSSKFASSTDTETDTASDGDRKPSESSANETTKKLGSRVEKAKRRFTSYPPPSLPNLERDTRAAKLKKGLFYKFFRYLKGYGRILEKVLPGKAVELLQVFSSGTKSLFADMKMFANTYSILSETWNWVEACGTQSRRELQLYLTLPADLWRVAPVLLLSAPPGAANVVFPIALMFPERLLSSHFWSPQQKWDIGVKHIQDRHRHYSRVLSDLKTCVPTLAVRDQTRRNIFTIESGGHPDPQQILAMRQIFQPAGAFHLHNLRGVHARHLMKMNGRKKRYYHHPRYTLEQYGNLLHEIDKAVVREGLDALDDGDLIDACFLRGLSPHGLSRHDMLAYLRQWMDVSIALDHRSVSLLLHLPIFLGYNANSRVRDDDK